MSEEIEIYVNKCRLFINWMLTNQQWSGISKLDINKWIDNFTNISYEEKRIIYKLLISIIYFSESDITDILKDGVNNGLFGKIVLQRQIKNKFQLSTKALINIVQEEIQKTCFIPLLDASAPHESGNYVSRLLVQNNIILPYQSIFPNQVVDAFKQYGFTRLVIVDDCVGSGDQLNGFWTSKAKVKVNNQMKLLRDWCVDKSIEVNYLVLFGYDKNIEVLRNSLNDINICCVRMLSDLHRVLSKDSYVWHDNDEYRCAYSLFERITNENGIELYGYANLDFAFIMHKTIPDWTLPILWRESADWSCLLRRKNSNA